MNNHFSQIARRNAENYKLMLRGLQGFLGWRRAFFALACIVASLLATYGGNALMRHSAAQENDFGISNAPAAQFCNSTPISITGSLSSGRATPYPSNITVSGLNGVITNVSVTLNTIQHDWSRDIDILLVGPHGEKFVVMSDVGWSRGFDSPATITLSDAGSTILTDQAVPIASGTYKPTNHSDSFTTPDSFDAPAPIGPYNHPTPTGSATFTSVFNNINPNGTWSLYVMDDDSSNAGSIAGGWCLDITTGGPPPNQIQFSSSNFNGDANSTASVTVNRVNPTPGAVAVNYATANGSATGGASCAAGVDYVSTSGT
ncbi:MAG: hypothetical protein M3R15_09630, partial [Acidobacteriota bacterium]|nr:hypothetical protein [Acidobacteriota bacterium]